MREPVRRVRRRVDSQARDTAGGRAPPVAQGRGDTGGGPGTSLSRHLLLKCLSWLAQVLPRPPSISSGRDKSLDPPIVLLLTPVLFRESLPESWAAAMQGLAGRAIPNPASRNVSKEKVCAAWHGWLSMGPCWLLQTVTSLSKCLGTACPGLIFWPRVCCTEESSQSAPGTCLKLSHLPTSVRTLSQIIGSAGLCTFLPQFSGL